MKNRLARYRAGLSAALWIATTAVLCGCPGSPLADLLAQQNGSLNENENGSGGTPPTDLPRPLILATSLQQGAVVIEFGLAEGTDTAEIFGYNVYRSEAPDAGFTRQRAFARFEDLVFVDLSARPGSDYFYRIVSVDRLGNESEPSDQANVHVPLAPNQVVVHADQLLGKLDISRFGVSDVNGGEADFSTEGARQAVRDLAQRWWRVGMARWDVGHFLTEGEIVEREFFTGTTLAEAASPSAYRWTYLDRVLDNVIAAGATPIITIDTMPRSLARTNELLFRVPLSSWSDNVRNSPPQDNEVFAEVVKHVIMHYTQGWANGRTLSLPYWELWHMPDLDDTFGDAAGSTWSGTQTEFCRMFADTYRSVKAEFGDAVKFGGAGFAQPESVGEFLDCLLREGVTPDFVSFAATADLPQQVGSVARLVQDALVSRSLGDVEMIVSDWNMALPVLGRSFDLQFFTTDVKLDLSTHAVHYLAVVQDFLDLGVTIATHDGLRDRISGFNPGLLRRDNSHKPVSLVVEAMQDLLHNDNRLAIEPDRTVALAGMNDEGTSLAVFLVNPNQGDVTFTLDFRALPWPADQPFRWSLRVLSDETFALGGFSERLSGTNTGSFFGIQPAMPPSSILVVEVDAVTADDAPPAGSAADETAAP